MGKCRCTQYKSLQIVMNGDHALVHKDREKGFENGGKEAAAQDASRSWKSQRCKSSGGIFLPKKEKISGAVRGRKDKRLQMLAVRGGNLCWKTWKCSETGFSSYDVGSVFAGIVHVGMLELRLWCVDRWWKFHVQLALKFWHMTKFCFRSFWDNSLSPRSCC